MVITDQPINSVDIWEYITNIFKIGIRSDKGITLYCRFCYPIRDTPPVFTPYVSDW